MNSSRNSSITFVTKLWMSVALLLGGSFAVPAAPISQEQVEDGARRMWDKRFADARARKDASERAKRAAGGKGRTGSSQAQTGGTGESESIGGVVQTASAKAEPRASGAGRIALTGTSAAPDHELIGVTIWRLRSVVTSADLSKPRLLVQTSNQAAEQFLLERANGDTAFKKGDRVRLSIEVPRETDGYLYVIDREMYADGTTSDPYLIFPATSTPPEGNVLTAGRLISVPAQGDPEPYFTLERGSRNDHVAERVTIIVSPHPLPVTPGAPGESQRLDPSLFARWERLWGGATEHRPSRALADNAWTVVEKDADEGKRRLVQGDPLPQVIYRIKSPAGGPVLVHVPLWIAR